MWLGNNITPLREEEWDEEEEEEADVPAPTSPPVSPVNSRFIVAFFLISNLKFLLSHLNIFGVHLEVNLSSMYGENIHVSHSAENIVLGLIFTPVRSFCLNCTAAGSCHPVQPERPLSS